MIQYTIVMDTDRQTQGRTGNISQRKNLTKVHPQPQQLISQTADKITNSNKERVSSFLMAQEHTLGHFCVLQCCGR